MNYSKLPVLVKTYIIGASFFALFHITLVGFYALQQKDIYLTNVFGILGMDLFFPELTKKEPLLLAASFLFAAAVFGYCYVIVRRKS